MYIQLFRTNFSRNHISKGMTLHSLTPPTHNVHVYIVCVLYVHVFNER